MNVIIDISSILAVDKFMSFELSREDFFNKYVCPDDLIAGVSNYIEALVLYDNVWIDKYYYMINKERFNQEFFKTNFNCSLLPVTQNKHDEIYRRLEDVIGSLPEGMQNKTLGEYISTSLLPGTALLNNDYAFTRLAYYLALQEEYGYHMLLHPYKGFSYDKAGDSSCIINSFEENVRKKFYEEKKKYLAQREKFEIKLPMIAKYVLNQCKSTKDLLNTVIEIRHSNKAKAFRKGISELEQAIQNDDDKKVNEILVSLLEAEKKWSENIIESLGKGFAFEVNLLSITLPVCMSSKYIGLIKPKKTGDKILLFIHELIKNT